MRRVWHLNEAAATLESAPASEGDVSEMVTRLKSEVAKAQKALDKETAELVAQWPELKERYRQDELVYEVRGREIRLPLTSESLARKKIPKVALPGFTDPGQIYRWMWRENLPGLFP